MQRIVRLAGHIAPAPAATKWASSPAETRRLGVTSKQKAELYNEGFVVVDNAVDPAMLPRLQSEARRIVKMARNSPDPDLCGGFISRDCDGDQCAVISASPPMRRPG